ncbi:NAD(P)/FAD-dependent oxidoreductase [Nonlabens sp. MIC269]|uniref:NAD(P)/FAD-dependent oxidoreductase n=1 Tax=Nonlabens sp. MIC269 TaxID=1476901 RepID=UPI0012FBA6D4|nr:NAD(P)/FAD-dependent oxidoreductase [Nonlabens sp. MIC269]
MVNTNYTTIIIGGGAAGFFTAINLAEQNPNERITILERGKEVLQKVKISGGGRCNVTHAQFIPRELSKNYPRGERELLGPFHTFMTGDTIAWFEERGVELKIEDDGRMFPTTDSSQTIIDCFISLARKHNIDILTSHNVTAIQNSNNNWEITTKQQTLSAKNLVVAAGSSPQIWNIMKDLGHTIVDAVPSLFTFNVVNKKITQLAGIAVNTQLKIPALKLKSEGPTLITHWGFSGPGILKMSAWGARELNDAQYKFELVINWTGYYSEQECFEELLEQKNSSKKLIYNEWLFDLPKRLWRYLVEKSQLDSTSWSQASNKQLQQLAQLLTTSTYTINGKSTFKEEFVTAGGVDLKEINFKTFGSRIHNNLYMAGEILNIDAITGGFNFQNAWTGGYLIAQSIAKNG